MVLKRLRIFWGLETKYFWAVKSWQIILAGSENSIAYSEVLIELCSSKLAVRNLFSKKERVLSSLKSYTFLVVYFINKL